MDNPFGDDHRHPSGGERVDRAAQEAIQLAHRAVARFPEVMRRHKFIAGGAAVSSSLVALAGVAVALHMRRGETAEEAVNSVTEDEIQGLTHFDTRHRTADADGADAAASNGHAPETAEVAEAVGPVGRTRSR